MPDSWSYSSSSASQRQCAEYILPQQDNFGRFDDGPRAPHRLRRQADTPRTPRDNSRDALRMLLEGITEQVWCENPPHFEPRFIQCDKSLKSLQLYLTPGN